MKTIIALLLLSVSLSAFSSQYGTSDIRDNPENRYGDGSHRDGIEDFYR